MRSHQVSILVNNAQDAPDDEPSEEPAFFGDLRLDQVISSLTAGRESFRLTPYLHRPLRSVETVDYRHQVLRDLEHEPVRDAVAASADGMARMRTHLHLADRLQHPRQQQRWFVSAAAVQCSVVSAFSEALATAEIQAPGLQALSDCLSAYTSSDAFASLPVDTAQCEAELSALTYVVQVRGTRVTVGATTASRTSARRSRAHSRSSSRALVATTEFVSASSPT